MPSDNAAARRMPDLWGGNAYAHHQMPQPQYLGAKHSLIPWIVGHLPIDGGTVLDGFGGSQSVAYALKKEGFAVLTNDFMHFCHQTGMALVENRGAQLDEQDCRMLLADNPQRESHMMRYKDIFFGEEECIFLDNFRANVNLLPCPYKRALALATICRSMTRKTIMGHFAHMQAMAYAGDPARVKRNPSIARPIRELFMELVPSYNAAVFDNDNRNRSHHANILELLPEVAADVQMAYYDPPYCKSHADYQSFYHLLETFVEGWRDKQFVSGTRRYHPPRYSGFDRVREIEQSFRRLFELSAPIPFWVISYNDRSVPGLDTITQMAARHKKSVTVERRVYKNSRGGRGSVSGSCEYLIICR